MTGGIRKNMAPSIHQWLNQARRGGRTFNELLQYFAVERFYSVAVFMLAAVREG